MRLLSDPNPTLFCLDESRIDDPNRGPEVPVEVRHKAGRPRRNDRATIELARKILGGDHDVIRHAERHSGTRLFVPKRAKGQDRHGALMFLPAWLWHAAKADWGKWFFDGVEEGFEGLDFGFDDVVPFMKLNYAPDVWFLVLRGPRAGRIGFWTHDGNESEDWMYAETLDAMLDRVVKEEDPDGLDPGLVAFGGVNVYPGRYAQEKQFRKIESLMPVRYAPDGA